MIRLNLTLDDDTSKRLNRHAQRSGSRRASLARQLLREGLERRDALERRKRLASDYAAGRTDAAELLRDLEAGQLEVLGEEDE